MIMTRFVSAVAVLALPCSLVACGSSSANPPGTGAQDSGAPVSDSGAPAVDSGAFTEGAHPPFPTITNHGVPVIASPKIVAVTFNGDTNGAGIASFVQSVGSSSYWSTVMHDYGVGAATGSQVDVTATLASSYSDDPSGTLADGGTPTMPAFVASTVTNAANKIPAPDKNTIYVFYLPATTSVNIQGGVTCTDAGGYHNSTTSGGATIVYAVVPECANASLGGRMFGSELDFLTFASSHEIAEAATDPSAQFSQDATGNPVLTAGFYNDFLDNNDDFAWNELADGETADFCVDQFSFSQYHDTAQAGTNLVQRIWSTSAASAGTNPCIPVPPGEVYFNVGPGKNADIVAVTAPNMPTTVNLLAFSDGPMPSWKVIALDGAVAQGQAAETTLSFVGGAPEVQSGLKIGSLPGAVATNNTTIQLSVTLTATLSSSNPFATGILISHDGADLVHATTDHYWPFIVSTNALLGTMTPQVRRMARAQLARAVQHIHEL